MTTMTTKTGRGSFAILWGSAAKWQRHHMTVEGSDAVAGDGPSLADAPIGMIRFPRDVDVIVGAWGGLRPPSMSDVRDALPRALQGCPLDYRVLDLGGCAPERCLDPDRERLCWRENANGVKYFDADMARAIQVAAHSVDLPTPRGIPGEAVVLLAAEDAAGLHVRFREVGPAESLSAAIRAGAYASHGGDASPLVACVREWLTAACAGTDQYIVCDYRERPLDGFAGRPYTGNGLRAVGNARTHVLADVWAAAEEMEPFLGIVRRLLDEGIHPTWIPDLRGDGSSGQEGPALRIGRRGAVGAEHRSGQWAPVPLDGPLVAEHRRGQWAPVPLDAIFAPRVIRREAWLPDTMQAIRRTLGLPEDGESSVAIERHPDGAIMVQPHAVGDRVPLGDFGLSAAEEEVIRDSLPRPASSAEIRLLRP